MNEFSSAPQCLCNESHSGSAKISPNQTVTIGRASSGQHPQPRLPVRHRQPQYLRATRQAMSQTKCNAEPTARSTGLSLRRHNCQPLSTLNEHETNDRSIRLIRLHRHRSRDPLGDPQPRPPDEQTTAVEPLDGDVPTIILPNLLRTTEVSHADDSTKASPRHPQRTRNQRHMMRQINPTSLPFIPHPQQANVCKQSYRRTTDDHPLRLYNCQPATHNEHGNQRDWCIFRAQRFRSLIRSRQRADDHIANSQQSVAHYDRTPLDHHSDRHQTND